MYTPKRYRINSESDAIKIINENPFASLVTVVDGSSWITQIPLTFHRKDGKDFLFGHVAKANPQTQHIKDGINVHCLFAGPHHYISPAWYFEKSVPTWDYMSAQVWGKVHTITDDNVFLEALDKLVDDFEAFYKTGFSLNELEDGFLQKNLNAIHGFFIEIKKMQGTHKLSQNKSEGTRNNVKKQLFDLNSDNARLIANRI